MRATQIISTKYLSTSAILAFICGIVLSFPAPVSYRLAFILLPAVVIFFALNPFAALMVLLVIRPELELFSESGLLKFFSAVPIIFLFYIFFDVNNFSFCWSKLKYFYIFILYSLCTIILSININESAIHILRLLSIVSIYLITFNLTKKIEDVVKLLYCFPIAVIIPIIIGAKQFLLGQTYVTTGTDLVRVEGLFTNANSFARFLFIIMIAMIPLFYQQKEKRKSLYILIFVVIATIIFLKVRGVILAVILSLLLLFNYLPMIKKYFWILIPSMLLISIPFMMRLFEKLINPVSQKKYGEESFYWRLEFWKELFNNAFTKKPLLGFGTGTSIDISKTYTIFINYPHNDYLRILIENGVIGLIIYLLFFISLFRSSFKEIKIEENKYLNISAFILISVYIFMSSAANVFYSVVYFWYFFGFLAMVHKMNVLVKEDY
ncbi:MAG: O-antigen ligase family protein [Nitrospirae bacterium]|nr:O-antigen ligase family protein [Nitrospirota bacterium]